MQKCSTRVIAERTRAQLALWDRLQGRTLPKLILSIGLRKKQPWNTLPFFYVCISRVRTLESLRLLQRDEEALNKVKKLKHDDYLSTWERGYDKDGRWGDELAESAWKARKVAKQQALQARALEEKERAKERVRARAKQRQQEKKQAAAAAKAAAKANSGMPAASARSKPAKQAVPCTASYQQQQRNEQILRDLGLAATAPPIAPQPAAPRVRVPPLPQLPVAKRQRVEGTTTSMCAAPMPVRRALPTLMGKRRAVAVECAADSVDFGGTVQKRAHMISPDLANQPW